MQAPANVDWPAEILQAERRIRPHILETPLERSPHISVLGKAGVYLKLEHVQHTGSFKLRGALNKILSLTPEQLAKGVIAASTGNHGMAVSYAAHQNGAAATVYMQEGTAPEKVELIRSLGGDAVFFGSNPVHAENKARDVAEQSGKVFISPYNDPQVIAGQGTVGVELHRQSDRIDAVFVSVGGGGLISGLASYLKSKNKNVEIVGCWPENSRVLYESMQAGRVVNYPEQATISDSTAGGVEEGAITLDLCQRLIDRCVLVSEEEIVQALRLVLEKERWIVEGAAALAVAAYLKHANEYAGKNVIIVLCGRNIPMSKLGTILRSPVRAQVS
jgi:threonine dehydratase